MMRTVVALLLSVFAACPCFAIDKALRAFKGLSGELSISGGTAPHDLMAACARRIMSFNPALKISVTGGGTTEGIRKAGENRRTVSVAGRPLSQEELSRYQLDSVPFAVDGVVAVVHPRNPVKGLSSEALEKIFTGQIANWRDVGGPDAPIAVYTRRAGSGARAIFEDRAIGAHAHAGTELASNSEMRDVVASDIYGIGYLAIGNMDESVRALAIDEIEPDWQSIVDGSYPVRRNLYLNARKDADPLVKRFVEYLRSPAGAELIRIAGYLPLELKQEASNGPGN